MKYISWVAGGVLIIVAGALFLSVLGIPGDSWLPSVAHEEAYRLVPEKVSISAAIAVAVPADAGDIGRNLSERISFNPEISGKWLAEKERFGGSAIRNAYAAGDTNTYYFKPDRPLEENRHYAVAVKTDQNAVLSEDFLAVADPMIVGILPANDEVLPNTKISIIFNRPMVPLSSVDAMTPKSVPVTIEPATQGKFKWISTHTLQFIPDTALMSSANYTVSVADGLKSGEGLAVKPQSAGFSTYHIRFAADERSVTSSGSVIRGYNQPFTVKFNQPVDLSRTSREMMVSDGTRSVPFTVAYWKTKKSDERPQYEGFFGQIFRSLSNLASASDSRDEYVDDKTIMAIYPEGGEKGSWDPGKNYTVTISRAYPESGGDITTESSRAFYFTVDDIVSDAKSISERGGSGSVSMFDPEGKLQISFYEDVDLDKSRITAPGLQSVGYDEKCASVNSARDKTCEKVPDHSRILASFKKDSLAPGQKFVIKIESLISDAGRQLVSKPIDLEISVYQPLRIGKVFSGDSLHSITVCSNNPLSGNPKAADAKPFNVIPDFKFRGWQESYFVDTSPYNRNACEANQYMTVVTGDLLPGTDYSGSASFSDVFGQTASANVDFTSRPLKDGDYELKAFQENSVVTVPDKTELTFSAMFLPEVTVNVCKMSAYDFYVAQNRYKSKDAPYSCESNSSRTIPLRTDTPGQTFFKVNIKDFYPSGIGNYLVTLRSSRIKRNEREWDPTRTFVSVTNLIVTEKQIMPSDWGNYDSFALTGDQISRLKNLYWVIDANTRQPVSGATVRLYRNEAVVDSAVTDGQGIAFITPALDADLAIATVGTDSVAVSSGYQSLNYAEDALNIKRLYLYTDKPLYRPGETVNFKGIYRFGYDGYYQVPDGQALTIKLFDSSGTVISEKNLTTDAYGSITTSFSIASEAALGSYRACIDYNCSYFDVLNYAPAAFQVAFDEDGREFNKGDALKAHITAKYYFGVPLSGAGVDYRVSTQYYYFNKYTAEYFSFNNLYRDDSRSEYYYGDRYLGRGSATLDENGEALITPEISLSEDESRTSKIIILDATVKNQQGRSIGAQKSFVLNAAPAYIGSKIEQPFSAAGTKMNLKLKTVDTAGSPIDLGSLEASVYLVQWLPNTVRRDDMDYTTWTRSRELVKTYDVNTDRNGDASIQLTVSKEGAYEVDVTSSKKGAAVGSRSWFYAYGSGEAFVRSVNDTYLNIVPAKENVKPGDIAEVGFEIPEGSAKALVTIERGKVFQYEIIDVNGTIGHYSFKVAPEYYPNVYISIVAYPAGHSVRAGDSRFVVDSDQKKLKLSVTPDKKSYLPGDNVTLAVKTLDEYGQPLSAQVSIAVVDMSVLALRGNPKKDPVKDFYGNVPLTVNTYSNFKSLLKYAIPAEENGGKGGGGGDPNAEKRRGVFRDVAAWSPKIQTDENGSAVFTFELPDNLTTWQAEAVAITKDTKVGAGYAEFTTNKFLMVTPLKPRFILPGDSFMLGATVFNRSGDVFDGDIELSIPSVALDTPASQKLSLKPDENRTLYWKIKVPLSLQPGSIEYSVDAVGQSASDRVDDVITVRSNTTFEAVATAGQAENSASETIYLPPSAIEDMGTLRLRTSATLAVFLTNSLDYVLAYPYDFTEQIATNLRTVALIERAQAIPNISGNKPTRTIAPKGSEFDEYINKQLNKLYSRQNSDGGFGYWSGSQQSDLSPTLRAMEALNVIKKTGRQIDEIRLKRAADYAYNIYSNPNLNLYGNQYVISDWMFMDLVTQLFSRVEYRNNSGLNQRLNSILQRILSERKTPTGEVLIAASLLNRYKIYPDISYRLDQVLKNKIIVDARGSFLDLAPGDDYYSSAIRNTANYLDLLVMSQTDDEQIPDLMRWLLSSRDRSGAWGFNTDSVVTAFADYLEWRPETGADFTLNTAVNGKVIKEFKFGPETVMSEVVTDLPISSLDSGKLNTVTLAKMNPASAGKIYYDMSLKYYLPASDQASRDEGLTIKRSMFSLSDTVGKNEIKSAKMGDVVREHLEITVPVSRRNVLIEDFIPAGMEIVDSSLATEDRLLNSREGNIRSSRIYPSHTEQRDDRQVLVVSDLPPGNYSFDYLIRALIPGTYMHLPAQASEMYNPENFGRTSAGTFTVEE